MNNPSKWTIAGTSIGGMETSRMETSLYVPELHVTIDTGSLVKNKPDNGSLVKIKPDNGSLVKIKPDNGSLVKINDPIIKSDNALITHHHMDHTRYVGRCRDSDHCVIDAVLDNYNRDDKYYGIRYPEHKIDHSSTLIVKVHELDHTVKSVAHGTHSIKLGYDRRPEVLFFGDTRIYPLYETPDIFKYPVMVIECTNYDPDKVAFYKRSGYISWQEIEPLIKANKDIYFLLIHPSSMMCQNMKRLVQRDLIDAQGIQNAEIWID
jgi:hypothetical protein